MLFRAPQLDTVARETPKYSANSLSFLKFSACLARFTIPVTSKNVSILLSFIFDVKIHKLVNCSLIICYLLF